MKEEKALQWTWHPIMQGYQDHLGKVDECCFSNANHQVSLRTATRLCECIQHSLQTASIIPMEYIEVDRENREHMEIP